MNTLRVLIGAHALAIALLAPPVRAQSTGGLPALREELTAETARALVVESGLQADLATESVRAATSEAALGAALEAERAARAEAIATEVAAIQAALSAEVAAREEKMAALQAQNASLQTTLAAVEGQMNLFLARESIRVAEAKLAEASSLVASVEAGSLDPAATRLQISLLADGAANDLQISLAKLVSAANVVGDAGAREVNAALVSAQQAVLDSLTDAATSTTETATMAYKAALSALAGQLQQQRQNLSSVLASQ